MLFRQLEYFVAVARERHFERAAEQCCVTSSALSAAITKLENELEVTLIERGRGLERLTPAGERLLLWAKRVLAEHDGLSATVRALRSGITGTLRLGITPTTSTTASLVLSAFCAAHPLVKVQIQSRLPTSELHRRLHDRELDAAIMYASPEVSNAVEQVLICEERYVLVSPANLLPEQTSMMRWPDVVEFPLVSLTPDMGVRRVIDAALAEHSITVNPQVETDSVASLFAQVASGDWACIVPHTWLWTTLTAGEIRAIELVDPTVSGQIVAATNATNSLSSVGRAFMASAEQLALDEFFEKRLLVET